MKEFLKSKEGKLAAIIAGVVLFIVLVVVAMFSLGFFDSDETKENPTNSEGLVIGDPDDMDDESSVDFSEFDSDDDSDDESDDKKDDATTDDKKDDTSADDKKGDDKEEGDKKEESSDDKKNDTLEDDKSDNGGTNWSPLF